VVFHEPRVTITKLISDDPVREIARLDEGVKRLRENIDAMLQGTEAARAGEHREILETYRMFAHDQGWLRKMNEAINSGLTAEAAVERVQVNMRLQLAAKDNQFWRDRMADLDDLANRLLRILSGKSETSAHEDLPKDTILVARSMGAAELLDYNTSRLKGLIVEDGGHSSHVAIVARSLNIAAAGNAKDVLSMLEPGNPVVLDAEAGQLHIRPSLEVMRNYADKARYRARRQEQYQRLRNVPAVTQDGQRIAMMMNAGLVVDLPNLRHSGADGVGLYRTELQFMIASTFPRREQQTATYREVLEAADGKPVVFRSLDVGGDKILPYMRHKREENPALGWRAIRVSLDRQGLFRTQIRALLKAAPNRELRVMLPFITEVAEWRKAKALIDKEMDRLQKLNETPPSRVAVGTMIEVPSILWQLDELFRLVDFASVGSNDLLQFFFAADRENTVVSDRFDALSVPPLKMLREIVVAAERRNVPLTLCGEMAGKPLEAMALIGLGYRSISMAPASLGPVKAMLLSVNARHIQETLLTMLDDGEPNIRLKLLQYAEANGVNLPATVGLGPTVETPPLAMAMP
jgi:phosphotransferase system, enzyme I, PtsP